MSGRTGSRFAARSPAVFDGFELTTIDTGEATIRLRLGGEGPPLLLLHGHPQTHAMWHAVAPRLAGELTVVAADVLQVWRRWAGEVRGRSIDCGHFLAEETPHEVYAELRAFFA